MGFINTFLIKVMLKINTPDAIIFGTQVLFPAKDKAYDAI
jgi:uncharacterized protein involved in propanediol utilization